MLDMDKLLSPGEVRELSDVGVMLETRGIFRGGGRTLCEVVDIL